MVLCDEDLHQTDGHDHFKINVNLYLNWYWSGVG